MSDYFCLFLVTVLLLTSLLYNSVVGLRSQARFHSSRQRLSITSCPQSNGNSLITDSVSSYQSFAEKITNPCRSRTFSFQNRGKRGEKKSIDHHFHSCLMKSKAKRTLKFLLEMFQLGTKLKLSTEIQTEDSGRSRRETQSIQSQRRQELRNILAGLQMAVQQHRSQLNYNCGSQRPFSLENLPEFSNNNLTLQEASQVLLR